jgi:hypothetical protein
MSGPSRYDPSLDFDSGDLSIPGSMSSPHIGSHSSRRRQQLDLAPPISSGFNNSATRSNGLYSVDSSSEAGPSRNHSARPHSPSPLPRESRPAGTDRTESQLSRSRSLNTHKKLPQLFTKTSAQSPLSATDRLGYSRRPGDPRPPPLITPQIARKVGRWVKEMVVCNFDLERGPVVERRIIGRRWGPGEKENVYVQLHEQD